MRLIQWILVPALLILTIAYFRSFRSQLFDRIIIVALGASGILLVLFPNLAQNLAQVVGVARGVDMVMYFGLVGLAFSNLMLFAKTRDLQVLVTEAVRNKALDAAAQPEE